MTTWHATKFFQTLRDREPVLAPFESGASLLEYLTSRDGDLDDKDRLYTALVRAVQARVPWTQLAYALLWCGLWPGLDRVYRRRLRHVRTDPDELTEAISVAFTMLVGRLDLTRVHRVAATLVRSTDREAMDGLRRARNELARRVGTPDQVPGSSNQKPAAVASIDRVAPSTGFSFAGELAALRTRLLPAVGADVDLVLAVIVLELDQHEAARRLGLTHEAARKRFQRAWLRVRAQLAASPPVAIGSAAGLAPPAWKGERKDP